MVPSTSFSDYNFNHPRIPLTSLVTKCGLLQRWTTTFSPSQCQTGVPLVYQLLLQKETLKHFSQTLKDVLFAELDERKRNAWDPARTGMWELTLWSMPHRKPTENWTVSAPSIFCSNVRAQLVRALVSPPDLIQCVYHFQYDVRENVCNTENDLRGGWFSLSV